MSDRRRLRSVSVIVGPYVLTITGLNDDAAPVELVARCTRCGAEISRRRYDAAGVALARVQVEAELDALRGLAHACGERN